MQEAPAPAAQGGMAETLIEVDEKLSRLAKAVIENPEVPDEAKEAFGAALEAYRGGVEMVMAAAGGGAPGGQGVVTPEAGGNRGAVPAGPQGVRRG